MDDNAIRQWNKEGLNMLYRLRSTKNIKRNYYSDWIKLIDMTDEMISSEIDFFNSFIAFKKGVSTSNNIDSDYAWIDILKNLNTYKRKLKIERLLNR